MTDQIRAIFVSLILCICGICAASERLDCWADIMLSMGASKDEAKNIKPDYAADAFCIDYVEKHSGSFSVAYDSSLNKGFTAIGFVSGEFALPWRIDADSVLCLNAKIDAVNMPSELIAELIDDNGNIVSISCPIKSGSDWQRLRFPMKAGDGFNINAVTACRFSQPFIKNAKIWFDDVYFQNAGNNGIIGVTEKPLDQRIKDAAATRQKRVAQALPRYRTDGLREGFQEILFKIINGIEIEQMNKKLFDILTTQDQSIRYKYRLNDHWCLVVNQTLYRLYIMYGSKGTAAAGRLTPETEKALLEELWNRTVEKNDMSIAHQSTWWMIGSENHDMVGKVSNLLASQIFKELPQYRDRILPDAGTGGGTGYWFDQMYGDDPWQGPSGRANFADGRQYNSNDHYQAWVAFMKEYITERLKKGFFLETFSSGYMGVTISHLYDVYDMCEDKELKELTGRFLDAIWCDWAQDTISGVKGGSKTRAGALVNIDSMCTFAQFEFGGTLASVGGNMWVPLVTSYRFPKIAWDIALDRQGLGSFEYISRRPGEEENIWPRPLGTERTMLCDTQARFNRYSWVTPDYVLGCQMDHPAAVHSHLSVAVRWQGLIFASSDNARVFPCQIETDNSGKWAVGGAAYFRNFQKNNVMISQQARRWTQANPDWYPASDMYSVDTGVYFGNNLDEIQEDNGWIFVRKNNAFAAVRVIASDMDSGFTVNSHTKRSGSYADFAKESYKWNPEKTMIKSIDKYSPVIIHAARRQDYKSMDAFREYILKNELNLIKTVVCGYFIVEYKPLNTSGGKDTYYFNAANTEIPMYNGKYVDYAPEYVFKSPYISSDYNSGRIEVRKGGSSLTITNSGEEIFESVEDGFNARSREVLQKQLDNPFPDAGIFVWHKQNFALAAMMLNERLDEANQGIIEACDKIFENKNCPAKCELHWNINLFFRIYELFNPQSVYYPSRLSPAAQGKIEDMMWFWLEANSLVSDAATEQSQSWYIWGSENHDAMNKTSSWSAAMILSTLPQYQSRKLKDGKTVTEHFIAWNDYFKLYLKERAVKGGMIEGGSHTYSKYTLQGWYNFYDFAQDPVLQRRAQYMLDLYWTCWSLEQIEGINSGAKSRVYHELLKPSQDCAYSMCWYYFGFGRPADRHPGLMSLATSNYRLPDVVKDIATDIKGRGRYEFYTRKLGRNIGPVGKADDGNILYKIDPQRGGLVKYTYITEDFVMGSFLQDVFDQNKDFWSMISSQNRWIGVAFKGGADALITPSASTTIVTGKKVNNYNQHISVQKNGTMIVRKVFKGSTNLGDMYVYIGKDMNVSQFDGKFIIAEALGGFAAVKPVWGSLEKVNDNWYKLSDSKSPVIIEAACKSDYASIDAFAKSAVAAEAKVDSKTNSVQYASIDGKNKLTFYMDSDKLPEINGKAVDIYPEYTYKSPYLNSNWDDGLIVIEKGNKKKILDFNQE